jgi:cytochrome b561
MTVTDARYRAPARLFHWATAAVVLLMIPAGFTMVQEGLSRSLQNTLFIFHKNVGVALLLIVAARLVYRMVRPAPPLPSHLPDWQRRVARATHVLLYALLLVMPLAGYIRVRAGGFPIEALDAMGIPSLVPRSEALASAAQTVHFLGAWAISAMIALHVAAALYHGLVLRDGVFGRMWPPVGRGSG